MTATLQMFDEVAFFQSRSGLRVVSHLAHDVGLENRPTRGAAALQHRQIKRRQIEGDKFGQPGSKKYAQALENSVDLGQIAQLISAQEGGKSGVLLNNRSRNVFAVRGKDGTLHVVTVQYWDSWSVDCRPFVADYIWNCGHRVFSN